MAEVFDFGLQQYKLRLNKPYIENNLIAVTGDTARRLEVQLLDGDGLVQNTTGIRLRLNAVVEGKATFIEATLTNANEGIYQLDLTNGMLLVPGEWQFQWQLFDSKGNRLNSFAFTGKIGENISEGATQATNFYFNADELKTATITLSEKFQSLIDETTDKDVISAPEIILARGREENLNDRMENFGVRALFSEYAHHISSDNFPVLTAGRRSRKTTDMEIVELGDSHGWGQGTTGNEWVEGQPAYSIHNPPITSRGFFEILNEHLMNKFEMYRSMIAFDEFTTAREVTKAEVNAKRLSTPNENTDHLEILAGRIYANPSLALQSAEDATFYSRVARNDVSHFGYNNIRQKMARGFYAIGQEGTTPFKLSIDMKKHARKMYMGVIKTSQACKIKIYFNPTGTPQTTAGEYYRNATGFPKIYRMVNGAAVECSSSEALVTGGVISMDTYSLNVQDVVYCIDWGFKQKGEVFIEYNGFVPASSNFPALNSRALHLRGIMFDRNIALNYSMGGHTTGGWLGTEASYQDAAYDHISEILRYSSFTPYLSLIQAPIVNEYLRQTPIATFKNNLAAVVNRLKNHRSSVSGRGTDILFLSTIGSRTQEFGNDQATIKYDEYFNALKEFCNENKYGYIDFRQLFKDNVADGFIDYQMLYHDSNHPSPFVHEFIGKELIKLADALF